MKQFSDVRGTKTDSIIVETSVKTFADVGTETESLDVLRSAAV